MQLRKKNITDRAWTRASRLQTHHPKQATHTDPIQTASSARKIHTPRERRSEGRRGQPWRGREGTPRRVGAARGRGRRRRPDRGGGRTACGATALRRRAPAPPRRRGTGRALGLWIGRGGATPFFPPSLSLSPTFSLFTGRVRKVVEGERASRRQ